MEKNKNISLDELFARAKGEEPVISQEDVRAITSSATSPMQSITKTTSIISRKGFIMSGLGLVGATAALIGYLSFGSTNVIPRESSTEESGRAASLTQPPHIVRGDISETTTPTVEPKKDTKDLKEVKVEKEAIIKIGGNGGGMKIFVEDDGTPTPKFDRPHTPDGKLMAPLEVEKVGIVQAKEADFPKLGLQKAPNGDLLFKASEAGGRATTIAIPFTGWGVKTNIVSGKDAETDVKLSPMIITDERGNRRFVNYADENTWVHMQRFNGNIPGGIVIDGENIPNISMQNDEINIAVNNDKNVDGNVVRSRTNMRKKIMISHDSSSLDNASDAHQMKMQVAVDHGNGQANNFKFDFNFADSTKDMNTLLEEAMKKAHDALKGMHIDLDSTKKAMLNIKIDNDFNWNGNLPGFDSMMKDFGKGMKHFKIEMKGFDSSMKNFDKEMKNFDKQMNSIMVIDRNFSDDEAAIFDKNQEFILPGLKKELEAVEEKLSAKINMLVPILVRKSTEVTHNAEENRDYDNGVIMWFEPEYYWKQVGDKGRNYEVEINGDMLITGHIATPSQSKQDATATTSSVVSGVSVYPNPVRTAKTSIHYKLHEARSVAFSIHDILGKKVVDCGSLAERPQGEYDFELNIGNIPAGIYLVVITTDKGEQTIQRIAVEK